MKKFLGILLLICTQNLHGTLTLDNSVVIALANRKNLKALAYQTKAFKSLQAEAMSGYLPQLNINAFVGRTCNPGFTSIVGNPCVGSCDPEQFVLIRASQLIFDPAGPVQQYNIRKQDTIASDNELILDSKLVRFRTEVAFLQAWLIKERKKVIDALHVAAQSVFDRQKHRREVNLIGLEDWLQAISEYRRGMANVENYHEEMAIALFTFEREIGYPNSIGSLNNIILDWNPQKIWSFHLKTIDLYYDLAKKNRNEFMIKDALAERERLLQRFELLSYLPSVSFVADVIRDNLKKNNCAVGLRFDWEAFDGFAKLNRASAAGARSTQECMEKENQEQTVLLEVQRVFHELRTLFHNLKPERAKYLEALNTFALQKLQREVGLLSAVDFDVAYFNVRTAEFNWISFLTSIAIKERELYFITGYPVRLVGAL